VQTADDAGWSIDALEAQAFAYLAVRSLRGLPISLPATTGVPRPLCGGVLAEP
jgi:anhydro-N-acetylmuramic acid kinase